MENCLQGYFLGASTVIEVGLLSYFLFLARTTITIHLKRSFRANTARVRTNSAEIRQFYQN